jgi:hypothetical protein
MILRSAIRSTRLQVPAAFAFIAAVAIALAPAGAAAKPKKGEEAKDKGPFKPWSEVTQGAKRVDGFFTVYQKPNQIFFALEKDHLGREFLGAATLAGGIGSNFLLGGLPLGDQLLEFRRVGNQVQLVAKNTRFTAPAGSPIEKAKDLSHGHSILAMLAIESENTESKAVLVDMTGVFVSDLTDLSTQASFAINQKPVAFDKDRSTLGAIKNFPENTEVEALLTYNPTREQGNFLIFGVDPLLDAVPDQRYLPITVRYSFVKLPEAPMKPRLADDRVGYFLTVTKDFSRDDLENFFVRYVDRWRLEKKDPDAALSEPVKPIVYYIDRTVPEQYHGWVKLGVEKWQKAFEAAGFKNAIVAKPAPTVEEDPNWDAEDTRYSTIRWITSAGASFNAIGPSRVDPRTGEIIDADILVEAAALQGYRSTWRRFAGPSTLATDVLGRLPADVPLPAERLCMNQSAAELDGGLVRATLLADGAMPPGSPVPDEYLEPFVVRLIMHEVGHTLGLRHNFRSSTATPFDKLHDVAWTQEHGLMGSVMDYVTPNINPDRAHQGEYFTTTAGTYDLFAIRYGYAPSGEEGLEADYRFAATIAGESSKPGNEYATDEDAATPGALDPRTHRWDLSDDPLRWSDERTAYIRALWQGDGFDQRILGEGTDYAVLRRAVDGLFVLQARTCAYATRYFGGQYHVRDHRGQAGAEEPLRPVPAAKQREAMTFLAERMFAPEAFAMSAQRLNQLAPDRWGHWGTDDVMNPAYRIDFDLTGFTVAMQTIVLNEMLSPSLLGRLREAENRTSDPYTLAEYMRSLSDAIWGEVDGAAGPGMRKLEQPTPRRELQGRYVDMLSRMVVTPFPGTPDDARAQARLELTRIDARAARGLGVAGIGDYTRGHLMEMRARIARTLDAERATRG